MFDRVLNTPISFQNLANLLFASNSLDNVTHSAKNVQIQSFFWSVFSVFSPNTGKYGPGKTITDKDQITEKD